MCRDSWKIVGVVGGEFGGVHIDGRIEGTHSIPRTARMTMLWSRWKGLGRERAAGDRDQR